MDEDTARAVVGLDVATIGNGEVGISQVMKLKLADKKGALELLGRHLGMWKDKTELTGPNGGPLQQNVQIEFVAPTERPKE
jgi:phage terminase small subunit